PNHDSLKFIRDLGKAKDRRSGAEALFQLGSELGYGNAPVGVAPDAMLENIQRIQSLYQIPESATLSAEVGVCQLDVEMETGTGKTYVYTKAMFELNKHYGWSKFIIVVPSVAIREGVFKSLESTSDHFFQQYGKLLNYFIYDSKNLSLLDNYSESTDISVMIINMQAFNTSLKEGGSGDARIIFSERDDFGSRMPIDVVAANRPIIIQDEPQKMGGAATKAGIKRFNPLFSLYFSATHKEKHNTVYALDSLDAYNQKLVKRIEVKGFTVKNLMGQNSYLYLDGIKVSHNKPPAARIEYEKMTAAGTTKKVIGTLNIDDDIYVASGELEQYRNDYIIAPDGIKPGTDTEPGTVTFLNGVVLERGVITGDATEAALRRIQIRETIQSHFQKEEQLFRDGIKCLSLFFIDEVAKYRQYDEDGNELLGEYGSIFEEEYAEALANAPTLFNGDYLDYLGGIAADDTHRGYFSIDRHGHSVDSTVKRGQDSSDDISAYELILKNKERLLSFEEPTRFIFSHSALREGWDNPNVFQICTLKHSDNSVGKRQEVGRGMRLCVNADGDRMDAGALGEGGVHATNVLTVIASESYQNFVGGLQSETLDELRDRPMVIDNAFFKGRKLVFDDGREFDFNERESTIIYFWMVSNGYVDIDGKVTPEYKTADTTSTLALLPDDVAPKAEAVHKLIKSVFDPSALSGMVSNGLSTKITENKLNDNAKRAEWLELWRRINHKYAYTVRFDDEELRRKAISHINTHLTVGALSYTMTRGIQEATGSRDTLESREHFTDIRSTTEALSVSSGSSVTYDLIGEVAQGATITRRSAAAILEAISPQRFALYKANPEEFMAGCIKAIIAEKATMIVDDISYNRIAGEYDSTIFTEKAPASYSSAYKAQKSIQDWVFPDGAASKSIEHRFAEDLDAANEVVVYAKLPRAFKIPTPVGNYAPDWAIAFEEGAVKHIFFVAETKGTMDSFELRGIEDAKIRCARKLFNEMSSSEVRYQAVASYDDLLQAMTSLDRQ
ncbi:MAG: DEAD/DEAH box helicase family protein, partial [Coriobacteriales bacterium]|nr:DEAD/DEAH box helicase family protein [Coriobacteriales bacterium]